MHSRGSSKQIVGSCNNTTSGGSHDFVYRVQAAGDFTAAESFYDTTQHLPLNFDTTQDAVSAVPTFVVKGRRYVVLAYAEVQRRLLIRQ